MEQIKDNRALAHLRPAMVVWHTALKDVPLNWFGQNNKSEDSLRGYSNIVRDSISCKGDSFLKQFFQITMGGHYFVYSIHHWAQIKPKKNFHWEVHVWDMTGSNSVGYYPFTSDNIETDTMPIEIYHKIISDCEDFVIGMQNCSGCNNKMKRSEIAGQYFAGRYCKNCWETKYKAIEAKETYN